ncbi:hypothetical protein [Pelagibacterium luteolum]|uniref:Uncharacterized protein n=1 Tax=Pelagibacterium luteolum TaxID=440168 RepID=A0A1G7ZI71_9HYPH|nr:hypothetical protein [Pelagibacterium luteolum]SDH08423.1 hypothetical protein SAMN04487974_12035 [Pelagibacterium luteolum]
MKTLQPTAMRAAGADYVRTYHHVTVDNDVTMDDILRPNFWAHHTGTLRAGDLVDVLSKDMSLDVQLRVIGKGVGYVNLRPRMAYVAKDRDETIVAENGDDLPDIPDNYTVTFTPMTKWRVHTKQPHNEIQRDLPSKKAAIEAAIEHSAKANG